MLKSRAAKPPKMVVVKHRPAIKIILLVTAVFGLLASYVAGSYFANRDYLGVRMERDSLLQRVKGLEQEKTEQQRRLAKFEVDASVEQRSSNEVRSNMADMRREIAELKSEISFYKGMMSPEDGQRSLTVRSMELFSTEVPKVFRFKIVLAQLAKEHSFISGTANVFVVGMMDGREIMFSLHDLSGTIESRSIDFRFKYFQKFEGQLSLPQGLDPTAVQVVVQVSGDSSLNVEQNFGWQSQEV